MGMCCGNRATAAATGVLLMVPLHMLRDVVRRCCEVWKGLQQMTLVAYIQVRGPYNNSFYNFFFIGYGAVSVFVGVVNPFEVIPCGSLAV